MKTKKSSNKEKQRKTRASDQSLIPSPTLVGEGEYFASLIPRLSKYSMRSSKGGDILPVRHPN